jgi:hypothetical protein
MGNTSSRNGFGDNHNTYAWTMEVFNDSLFVGTLNVKRQFYTINPWEIVKNMTKGKITFMVGSDLLKVKSDGCEIWKTTDGNQWIQVVGNETIGLSNGFGDINNSGTRSITKYKFNDTDSLIIGTSNVITGCEIWKYQ